MTKLNQSIVGLMCVVLLGLFGCQTAETGTIELRANGEAFVREGFVSKDGWQIDFDQVYVNLVDITVFQTEEPYDAATGERPTGHELALSGARWIDLAEGDEQADPILVEALDGQPIGQFNAISWQMVPGAEGQTLQLTGTAEKDGQVIQFELTSAKEYAYVCGEFVGDERKGFVTADGTAESEMTFHFDHVFGDVETPQDDALNVGAIGFGPLAELASTGTLSMSVTELEAQLAADDFAKLDKSLQTLGHVGEGHCYESTGGYTGDK